MLLTTLLPNCSYGDIFDPEKHSSGTEIKAITYSNMQVHEAVLGPGLKEEDTTTEMGRVDLFVIVDI